MNTINNNMTIGEIVRNDFRTTEILNKYKIDYWCSGKITIDEACTKYNVGISELTAELEVVINSINTNTEHNFNDWELDYLIDYIINVHHKYVNENLPLISEITQKITSIYGENYPELILAAEKFELVEHELNGHMMKEEKILFPYIIQLYASSKNNKEAVYSPFGTVRNPIRMMEMEHENAVQLLKEIRDSLKNLESSFNDKPDLTYSINKFYEFEDDLHQHIHLENNILFPKSIELEKEMLGTN